MAVNWKTVTTYPIADSQTLTAMDPVKLSSGKVQEDTTSLSQDIIGFSTQTISMGVLATVGQQEYVGVVSEGMIELTGMVEGSGGTYTTDFSIGATVSIYWSGSKPYAVVNSSGPIGKVIAIENGTLVKSGGVANATGTVTIEIDLAINVAEIGAGSVSTAELANGAVKGTKIYAGGVGTAQIANGAVKGTKIGAASITLTQMAAGSVSGTKIVAGGVDTAQLADGAVKGTKIEAGGVGTTQLAASCVEAGNIAAGIILNGTITSSAQISEGVLFATHFSAGAVETVAIANGAVKGTKINAGGVDTTQIADGAVKGTKIEAGGVGTAQIADGAIKGTKVNAGGVDTTQLAAGACTGTTLGADVVTGVTASSYAIDMGGYVIGSTSTSVVVDFTATLSGTAKVFCQPLTETGTAAIPSAITDTNFTVTGTNSQTGDWLAVVV